MRGSVRCRRSGRRRTLALRVFPVLCLALALAAPGAAAGADPLARAAETPPTASLPPPGEALPPDVVYLGQTGHYLRDDFLVHWRAGGGAARFGYPLSEQYEDEGADGIRRPVQLFDKARFELHAGADGGARVELGHLGRDALGPRAFPAVAPFEATPEREYVAATGHSLGAGFRDFWQANDGIRLLGYPLSEELAEGALIVQYFERGRLEYDPAAPPDRAVRMAPLGAQLVASRGWPRPARLALTLNDAEPGQGTTAVADLFADRPVTVVAARFDDRPIPFFGGGFYHRAIVGVPPSAAPGPHTLAVEVRDGGGATKTVVEEVQIRDAAFPRERITVPPDQGDLLDPAVAEREARVVEPLYRLFTPERSWRGRFEMPAQGPITTEFGVVRAYNDGPYASWHNGLDIGAPEGAPVVAPAPGRVVHAGPLAIRGNFVAIDHGFGVLTCYFHLSEIAVAAGQGVDTGDALGRVGTTGLSTGAHLHWEVRVSGVPVTPWQWVRGDVLP